MLLERAKRANRPTCSLRSDQRPAPPKGPALGVGRGHQAPLPHLGPRFSLDASVWGSPRLYPVSMKLQVIDACARMLHVA